MKFVARKAQGSRRIVAKRKPSTVSATDFAQAFDATPIGTIGDDTNPLSLMQIRSELEKRLRSSGGRPSLATSEDKWKVGILDEDVPLIKKLTEAVGNERYRPSPAQIASLLIHIGLDSLKSQEGMQRFRESTRR